MKKGFYFLGTRNIVRCYFLTGEKMGNKWIELAGIDGEELVFLSEPEWITLFWTCLPDEEELEKCTYFETNPTKYNHEMFLV